MPPWICRIPSFNCSLYIHKFPHFAHIISFISFSTSTPSISLFDYLVNNHQFSPECAAKVSSSPSSSSSKYLYKPHYVDSFLNFLKENGFSKLQIESVVRKESRSLFANFERTTKRKFKVFHDLGFHSSDLPHIILSSPNLLLIGADRLRLSVLILKNVLEPNADISRLLMNSSGRVLRYDLNKTLVPNIEYLKSCGICSSQITTYVCRFPSTYTVKPDNLKDIVHRIDVMGVDRESNMFIEAVRVMSSYSRENWELKLRVFRELGFSEQDILVAFRQMPQAFGVSENKIKEVTQLLLNVENISYIASNPAMLGYSVDSRLKPRLRVLKALQSKSLLKKKPGLARLLRISDPKFIQLYVSPYANEVGGLYLAS